MLRTFCALALLARPAFCADADLFNHKNLDGWEVIGDGVWHVLSDGTLMGERDLRPVLRDAPFLHPGGVGYRDWLNVQSWLYTKRNDFAQFDLTVEYWVRAGGNSGISIRDTSRAQYAIVHAGGLQKDAVEDRLRNPDQQPLPRSASHRQHLWIQGCRGRFPEGERLEHPGYRVAHGRRFG